MHNPYVQHVAVTIAGELEKAYLDALEFITDLRDVPPEQVRTDAHLQHEVAVEALITVAHRTTVTRLLADRLVPTVEATRKAKSSRRRHLVAA